MPDSVSVSARPAGFRLSELVLLLVILLALGLVLMPAQYDDRRSDNERNAQDMLRMIATAQESFRAVEGQYAELFRLQFAPGREPNELEPMMPFLPASADFAHYGGYTFQEVTDGLARPIGCIAEPRTPPFSGERVFEIRYGETDPVLVGYMDVKRAVALR